MAVLFFASFVFFLVVGTIVILDPHLAPAIFAVLAATVSFIMALRAARGSLQPPAEANRPRRPSRKTRPPTRWIVVDGSNVLYWNPAGPSLATVAEVLQALDSQGFRPVVWFDANVGYVVGSAWMGPQELSRELGVSQKQVLVAASGQQADPLVLAEARKRRASVVTNDRFRDWVPTHPEVLQPGFLIRGDWGPDGPALRNLELVPKEEAA